MAIPDSIAATLTLLPLELSLLATTTPAHFRPAFSNNIDGVLFLGLRSWPLDCTRRGFFAVECGCHLCFFEESGHGFCFHEDSIWDPIGGMLFL